MNEPIWVNYHKHTSLSNRYMKDSPLLPVDYWNELKARYGDKSCIYTTVEHGWAGNYFKQYDDLEKFNKKNGTNIRWIYGAEAYWVKDRHESDRSNCHIVLLARTDKGRKAINKILSIANKDGYYARPRIDLELIGLLPYDDVMITTACIAFWNKYDDIGDIVRCLVQKFPHFYLEVQAHDTPEQKELNRRIIQISEELNIPIIAGCDSHVITEAQMLDRDELLKSGNIHYEDEDEWYMDYPTYDVLFERFKQQDVLTDGQIKAAINNTNVLFEFEDIKLDRSLKVPVIKELRNKTQEERNHIFEQILKDEWFLQKADINKDKLQQYYQEIKHDIGEIEACNMADYFILSYMVMKRGQEKYGGILTPSGRGSAVSMYLNKLLRLTKVDKVNSPVLMYSERFLTKERVLDSHTPPDIDNNVSDRQPFIQAQRDLVGELGTYDLLALGTLKFKAAWKMYARAYNVEPDTANEVSKQIDRYETAKKHAEDGETVDIHKYIEPKYQKLVDGCKKYLGIYDTAKGHPCGCLCYEGDIESDIGISLCKSEATGKEVLVANIESGTIDAFGYLKQDYLIVDSIGLTYDIYKEAGIEPFTVNQLLEKIAHDDATWQIYADGYTQCVNQCEQPRSTQKVMRYKPKNIAELTQFIAAIRPSFQSMYQTFEQRQHFDYGIKALDDLLQDEYCSSSFILYQESLMKVLGFAGFPMSETYTIIKAISKKKDYIIKDAKPKFIKNFAQAILDTGETDDDNKAHELADKVWTIIENSAAYGFNSAHAYCMAIDSVTIAYLKAHYPLEFYKCVLQRFTDKGEKDKVALIKQEMLKRGYKLKDIQFGDDNRAFNIDRANNCIVQTMASIKDMPKSAPEALYELGKANIKNRAALYQALMDDPRINKKAIEILFHLGYFDKFAQPNRLIVEYEIYQKYISAKVLTKSSFDDIMIDAIRPCCGKETEKQFRDIDNKALITALIKQASIKPATIVDRIKWQLEYLGYCTVSDPNSDPNDWLVLDIKTTGYGTVYVKFYNLCFGVERTHKVNRQYYSKNPINVGDCIKAVIQEKDKYKKSEDGEWIKTGEKENIIKCWKILDK
uniref:DNA polymerase III, alpha subunit n=1 Tax=Siphoviridae sp. ctKcB20 TaxID=2827568 RepID=A0A8S5LL83_9CAUD|nr:MAG TPA: DNA polymerase III, alpha subunit [Siphoviridae sp. ctKcB20]